MTSRLTLLAATLAVLGLHQPADIGPAPGRLVDVGGRRLHLHCIGNGSPTVVLEAGASSFALDWTLVQSRLARARRVCAYDRAGAGWSDPREDVETPARVTDDLHRLLTTAAEKPPFVMVGASMGGLYVRRYQLEYPADVVGMVLVDAATEDRLFTIFQGATVPIGSLTAEQLRTTLPAGPVTIPSRAPQTGAPFDRLPSELFELRIRLDRRLIASFPPSVSAEIVRESSEGRRVGLARLLASRDQPDNPLRKVPLIVLTRGQDMTPGIADNHAGLARLSSNARHVVVKASGHQPPMRSKRAPHANRFNSPRTRTTATTSA